MTGPEIIAAIREEHPECLLADGFEEAVIGMVDGACRSPVVCYDYCKCVEILMRRDGMSDEEAEDFMGFNVTGAFVGELTPLFLHDWRNVHVG